MKREELEQKLYKSYQKAYEETKEGQTFPTAITTQQIDWVMDAISPTIKQSIGGVICPWCGIEFSHTSDHCKDVLASTYCHNNMYT